MISYVLDARTATNHFPGIGRYVFNLARAMAPLLEGDERLTLLRDPTQPSPWDLAALAGEKVRVVDVPLSPFALRQQWEIPRLLHHLKADLYHSPYYLMPYWPGASAVVTVYDLIPLFYPQHVSIQARLLSRWAMALALRAAAHIIAISQATGRDLLAIYGISPQKVTVIPLAVDPCFYPQSSDEVERVRGKYALPEDYILYLGSNKPHKNLVRLVEAWAKTLDTSRQFAAPWAIGNLQPMIPLVIAGAWDPRYPQARQRAEELCLGEAIRWLGPVPEADLPALYTGAIPFIFPSLYEGFGLPVLEAMACGTPVICSNTSSLPEVAGDAALLVDPRDVEALAATIKRALTDKNLQEEMRSKGLAQAARFSWQHTARVTLKVYKQ